VQRLWKSATLGCAAFAHLYGNVFSQHRQIPTVARFSPHDTGPELAGVGVVRSTRLEAVQSVHRVWTGPTLLRGGSLLCGPRRRCAPGTGPLGDQRTGLPISARAVDGGAAGIVSGTVRLRLVGGIPRVGAHRPGAVPRLPLVRGNQGAATRLVVE